MQRRTFLNLATAASSLALLPGCISTPLASNARKKILILGGTNFLGPALVEHATLRGHEITLFNRGITRPNIFPNLEKLRGNRQIEASDLTALEGTRRWDAVIDVWPEHSNLVKQTTDLLADRTDYYFFCSSIAAYSDYSRPNMNESAATRVNEPGWYGGEKAITETVLAKRFAGRYGVSRCHAMVGPRDNGVAFHYWLRRMALQDEVLAPGSGNDFVQYVDVRDVAAWIIDCVEQHRVGIHNMCGPSEKLTFRSFLEGSREGIGSNARLVWVDADFLRKERKIQSFSNMPLWAPLDEDAGFYQIDTSKSVAAGATFRPLTETARDAWLWYQSYFFKDTAFPVSGQGITRERELEVLKAWQSRS